jgi:hypothetical protein
MAKQSFTVGQVLTAAQLTSLQQTAMLGGAASAKTASYTLVAADAGTTISMTSTSATTVTVNTGLFAAGDTVFIQNLGSGNLTVTAGTATVATAGSLILPQNDAGILYFVSTSSSVFYDFIQVGATSPLTTKGDLYGFGTSDARIPIGANNTVLTADSGETLGLKWATPATVTSGATFISRTTFSAVSTVDVDSIFSDTYENYLVCGQFTSSSGNPAIQMQGRHGSTTITAGGYYYGFSKAAATGSIGIVQGSNDNQFTLCFDSSSSATQQSLVNLNIFRRSGATANLNFTGTTWGDNSYIGAAGAGSIYSVQTYTGLRFKGSSGTISGQVTVYGLAAS